MPYKRACPIYIRPLTLVFSSFWRLHSEFYSNWQFALLAQLKGTFCWKYTFVFCFSGTSGKTITVQTNYFKLECAPDWHLYQYHVDFNPPVVSRKLRVGLLADHKDLLGTTRAFDGMVLFLPRRLQQDVRLKFLTTFEIFLYTPF